jgi:hypothetical protein
VHDARAEVRLRGGHDVHLRRRRLGLCDAPSGVSDRRTHDGRRVHRRHGGLCRMRLRGGHVPMPTSRRRRTRPRRRGGCGGGDAGGYMGVRRSSSRVPCDRACGRFVVHAGNGRRRGLRLRRSDVPLPSRWARCRRRRRLDLRLRLGRAAPARRGSTRAGTARERDGLLDSLRPGKLVRARSQARSSVVEHYLDTVGVTGSIPAAPTKITRS